MLNQRIKFYVPLLLFLCGCAHISATKTIDKLDDKGKVTERVTIKGGGTFFISKSEVSKLVLGKETKTTSQLFGADSASNTGDVETLKALQGLINDLLVKAAMAAAK